MRLVRFLAEKGQPADRALGRVEYGFLCIAGGVTAFLAMKFITAQIGPMFASIGAVLTETIGR